MSASCFICTSCVCVSAQMLAEGDCWHTPLLWVRFMCSGLQLHEASPCGKRSRGAKGPSTSFFLVLLIFLSAFMGAAVVWLQSFSRTESGSAPFVIRVYIALSFGCCCFSKLSLWFSLSYFWEGVFEQIPSCSESCWAWSLRSCSHLNHFVRYHRPKLASASVL